jgi:hypothetical protein
MRLQELEYVEGFCRWKFECEFYTFIKPNQEKLPKMQQLSNSSGI